jgi:hypothetical protein
MRACGLRLCALLLLAAAPARAAEATFVRIWPAWRDAASFERLGELFGGAENTGREIVHRSQPAVREGYYFLVRLRATAAISGTRLRLDLIRPDAPAARTYEFPAPLGPKETVFQVGLTGTDWPGGAEAHPVAWKLTLLSATGHPLAEHKSFLWEKPAP